MKSIKDFIYRSQKIKRHYKNLNILYLISICALFVNFYSDLDSYNQGLSINMLQGELSILGTNILLIQIILIFYNIDKRKLDNLVRFFKNIELQLFNLISVSLSIYIIFLYFFITQSNSFGVNPLFKTYGIGFYILLASQVVALYQLIKAKQ